MIGGYFKSAQDGRKLFYPWGPLDRGYVIASEQDYRRVARELKTYIVILVVLSIGVIFLAGYLSSLILMPVPIVFYVFWKPYLVRGLQLSEEKLSLRESYTNQALARSSKELWSWEIAALMLLGVGLLMIIDEGVGYRFMGIAALVISVFVATFATWMLVLRRRASRLDAPR